MYFLGLVWYSGRGQNFTKCLHTSLFCLPAPALFKSLQWQLVSTHFLPVSCSGRGSNGSASRAAIFLNCLHTFPCLSPASAEGSSGSAYRVAWFQNCLHTFAVSCSSRGSNGSASRAGSFINCLHTFPCLSPAPGEG